MNRTATDDDGNESTGTFNVTVSAAGDPVLVLPSNITAEATGAAGVVVDYTVTATDDVDPSPDISCTFASGSTFPIGETPVDCVATDNDGNSTTGTFTITVSDTSAPVLDLPDDIDVTATGADGVVVTWVATANDGSFPGVIRGWSTSVSGRSRSTRCASTGAASRLPHGPPVGLRYHVAGPRHLSHRRRR